MLIIHEGNRWFYVTMSGWVFRIDRKDGVRNQLATAEILPNEPTKIGPLETKVHGPTFIRNLGQLRSYKFARRV
jgi:hypothetical protein